jgi:hypothetical protein
MSKIKDLTGQRFGYLVAIENVGKNERNQIVWHCKCDCGGTKNVSSEFLIRGSVKSCGCINKRLSELNSIDNSLELNISSSAYQEIKNRLGYKGKITHEQLDNIKKEVDEIKSRFGQVTLWSINRYWNYVRECND